MADDEATEARPGVGAAGTNKVRSKNGVARSDLKTIDDQAGKIWTVARRTEVAEVQIARAITGKADAVASGGGWRARIATLRLYGVVEKTREGHFKMTDLGIALANIGDEAAHQEALRTAVVSIPANARILKRYDGGQLPSLDTLATEFEFGYSMSSTDATAAAKVFIASAKYAGLVDDSDHVDLGGAVSGTEAEDATDDETENDDPGSGVESRAESQIDLPAPRDTQRLPQTPQNSPPLPAPPALGLGSSPAALSVKLDMSGWAVEDVLRVLAALGFEGAPRESDG